MVTTPARLVEHIGTGAVDFSKSLKMLVVDEADLMFSYGYVCFVSLCCRLTQPASRRFEEDMRVVANHLPKITQSFLMSATLSSDVKVPMQGSLPQLQLTAASGSAKAGAAQPCHTQAGGDRSRCCAVSSVVHEVSRTPASTCLSLSHNFAA